MNFIDSRIANAKTLQSYDKILNKEQSFEKEFKQYNFDYAIIFYDAYFFPSTKIMTNNMPLSIVSYLFEKEKDWKLIYWDDKSLLFVKNKSDFNKIIDTYEFKYLSPYNYLYRKQIIMDAIKNNSAALQKELNRKLNEEPFGVITKVIWKNICPLIE